MFKYFADPIIANLKFDLCYASLLHIVTGSNIVLLSTVL